MGDDSIDTAIVGGGVSGVYSAWRLKQANPPA
jgi:cation diffusion facilitator CzcD-associated flavoprotein CzcO